MKSLPTITLTLFTAVANVGLLVAGDWPRFRGPNGSGVSADNKPTPVKWSKSENLKWKAKLPGLGVSSPIVVGECVMVTCYSGYGMDRQNPGDLKNLKRHLVCIDRKTGKTLWAKTVYAVLPEDQFGGMGLPEHGYASHTPVSDGKRVYVFFGKTGALAFDMDGKQLWQTGVGTESDPRRWGSASSPVLYKNLLIVTAPAESQAMVALNTLTGQEVWRQAAMGFDGLRGTPTLVQVDENRTDLVVGVPFEIWGLNPKNGKLRWFCEGTESELFNSSVVSHDGLVYGIEGPGGGSLAVRAGGKGDVTKTHVVWRGRNRNQFGTPIVHQGRVYFVAHGIINCINATTGKQVFQTRLQGAGRGGFRGLVLGGLGGGDYSSAVVADGKLYYVRRSGDIFVLKADTKFELLSVNRMTDDNLEEFKATPAISDGELFVRSSKHLYCVAATN